MQTHEKFPWDTDSDQPFPLVDKKFKRRKQSKVLWHHLKTAVVAAAMLPVVAVSFLRTSYKVSEHTVRQMVGMNLNLDRDLPLQAALIEELGITHLALRVPLSAWEKLQPYRDFIQSFDGQYDFYLVVLQDRIYIDDPTLSKKAFASIFKHLGPLCSSVQIGNASNRSKWGFFSIDEYLSFYNIAQQARDEVNPHLKLSGSVTIDFEVHYAIRSLFHGFPIRYDQFAALLYVDRRGSPESKQAGFNLRRKIRLFSSLHSLSKKCEDSFVIAETNWPLKDTAPYAPAVGPALVDEDLHGLYMLRYYLCAISTGLVDTTYWHQLIAPGYGLIDDRNGRIQKRPAFKQMKVMLQFLGDKKQAAPISERDGRFHLSFSDGQSTVEVIWADSEHNFSLGEDHEVYNSFGQRVQASEVNLNTDVLYKLR